MTLTGWMIYALAISLLLAPAAWLLERGLSRIGLPTRWVWLGALTLSLLLPVAGALRGTGAIARQVPVEIADLELAPVQADVQDPGGVTARVGLGALRDLVRRLNGGLDRALSSAAALVPNGAGVQRWVGGLWAGTSLLLAFLTLASLLRLARRARGWPVGSLSGREVRISPDLGPATIGLFVPEIVVPRWTKGLRSSELEIVLTHEEEHRAVRDPLVLALGLLPAIACPWNPLTWWQLRRLGAAVEVDCDRRVLRRGAPARLYGDLLLRLGCVGLGGALAVPNMAGSHALLERRLTAMKKKTRLQTALPGFVATTIAALGLVAAACGADAPMQTEPQEAMVSGIQEPVLELWVQADGTVLVDDEPHAIEELSELVARLNAETGGTLVVSVGAPPGVPYRVMFRVQQALVAADAVRVLFAAVEPGSLRSTDAGGLGIVLPEEGMELPAVPVSQRNLLHLVVQPDGTVDVRKGESVQVQRMQPEQITDLWRLDVALNPNLIAAIKVHPEAAYEHMVTVLDALHSAHAQRISIQELQL